MVASRFSASAPLRRHAPPARYIPIEAWTPQLLMAARRWLSGTRETGSLAGDPPGVNGRSIGTRIRSGKPYFSLERMCHTPASYRGWFYRPGLAEQAVEGDRRGICEMGLKLSDEGGEFIGRYQSVCYQRRTVQLGKGD